MATIYTFPGVSVNVDALDAQLRERFGAAFDGLLYGSNDLRVVVLDDKLAAREGVQAVLDAHDPAELTVAQQEAAEAMDLQRTIKNVLRAEIAWHQDHAVTDAASALAATKRMQTELILMMRWLLAQV